MGSSIRRCMAYRKSPARFPPSLRSATYEWFTERKTASRIEHRKEIPREIPSTQRRVFIASASDQRVQRDDEALGESRVEVNVDSG